MDGEFTQGSLFESEDLPTSIGHAKLEYYEPREILTRATGFMSEYDFTLNPYSGCSFGCNYCYAAFFIRDETAQNNWGHWVRVKKNAVELLRKRSKSLQGQRIYMSSVTDPYQPIERQLELVRELLEILVDHQPRLVVQTRSPMVVRDIDLFSSFDHVQVNMTVTTDSESVRKAFEPLCPSNEQRLEAIAKVHAAGVPSMITMTPLLPVDDPTVFSERLLRTGVERFVVQNFHSTSGKFVRGTRKEAEVVIDEMNWSSERYRQAVEVMRELLPVLSEGKEGFSPI